MQSLDLISSLRIKAPGDVRGAAEAFRDGVLEMTNLKVAACHNIAVKEPMVDAEGDILASEVFGWPCSSSSWWQTPRLALDSPMTTACRYESEPFWMNALGIHSHCPNPFLAGIDLSNFELRAKTRAAIVVPVHLPFGQIGAVSFNPIDDVTHDLSPQFEKFGDELGVLARTFISGYVQVMCRAQRLPASSKLSKREVECLRWAAVGKTDLEIGLIMSRSRATIRFHIHNASVKLNAVNRSQTVFKAAQLGYIAMTA
ncbi:MAG: helix-turn-helix transcriptional regulator [Caulobacterales bacterium]